ncbi:hypothetical protein SKAU_G00135340 [Synaphobranchus kaupii]|uniref:Uncharacterized protein n=1 Tax=Synaphobranchus kaupii TaxID=118154 RepID=A0A9Q1FS75_SYNKA|nr:hypothetical protein SKAU_G00135340 [Synaphobranchus kaupii]
MQYLQKNAATGDLERGLKNKWRWQWLEETDSQGQRYDVWLAKVDIPGMAWCKLCNKNIAYAQNGKKVFAKHTEDHHHREMVNQQQHTQTLPGAHPIAAPVSRQDQREGLKAITAAFVAEHCLPFSLAPHLVEYAKRIFLQMIDVVERVAKLEDALVVYYSGFLTPDEKKKCSPRLKDIMERRQISGEVQARLLQMQETMRKQSRSDTNSDRKDRIIVALINNATKFQAHIKLYQGLLPELRAYVKLYQSEKPTVHTLHKEMFDLTRKFIAFFVRADEIPECRVSELLRLDLDDRNLQVSVVELCLTLAAVVGQSSTGAVSLYDCLTLTATRLCFSACLCGRGRGWKEKVSVHHAPIMDHLHRLQTLPHDHLQKVNTSI